MGTTLISGRGAPCPAPAQRLEIDLSGEPDRRGHSQGHRQTHLSSGQGGATSLKQADGACLSGLCTPGDTRNFPDF